MLHLNIFLRTTCCVFQTERFVRWKKKLHARNFPSLYVSCSPWSSVERKWCGVLDHHHCFFSFLFSYLTSLKVTSVSFSFLNIVLTSVFGVIHLHFIHIILLYCCLNMTQNNNPHEWLQVDLGKVKRITGVITQGARSLLTQMMVTEFSVTISHDGQTWSSVLEESSQREKVQFFFFPGWESSKHKSVHKTPMINMFLVSFIPHVNR